ncbi:MAG: SDR family NAD(P)-dependent oxidoreductase [Myxococcota bacterium]
MERPHQDVVLLTGASVGLGLAIARQLIAQTDHRLILTARAGSLSRFGAAGIVENERIHLRPLDVTSEEQRQAIIDEADREWGGVDVLINNAGVSYRSVVEHVDDNDRLRQMDINFRSPMELIRLVLPAMRRKRRGRIINISSVGGMMAMPTMGVYSASKFALEGASEALWYEVRPWNIRVSLVQPGFIHSESFKNVRFTDRSQNAITHEEEPYHAHYAYMEPFIGRMMRMTWATPERVARTVLRTMRRRRPPLRVPGTLDARLFSWLRRLLPRRVYHWFLYINLPRVWRWGPAKTTGSVLDNPRLPELNTASTEELARF